MFSSTIFSSGNEHTSSENNILKSDGKEAFQLPTSNYPKEHISQQYRDRLQQIGNFFMISRLYGIMNDENGDNDLRKHRLKYLQTLLSRPSDYVTGSALPPRIFSNITKSETNSSELSNLDSKNNSTVSKSKLPKVATNFGKSNIISSTILKVSTTLRLTSTDLNNPQSTASIDAFPASNVDHGSVQTKIKTNTAAPSSYPSTAEVTEIQDIRPEVAILKDVKSIQEKNDPLGLIEEELSAEKYYSPSILTNETQSLVSKHSGIEKFVKNKTGMLVGVIISVLMFISGVTYFILSGRKRENDCERFGNSISVFNGKKSVNNVGNLAFNGKECVFSEENHDCNDSKSVFDGVNSAGTGRESVFFNHGIETVFDEEKSVFKVKAAEFYDENSACTGAESEYCDLDSGCSGTKSEYYDTRSATESVFDEMDPDFQNESIKNEENYNNPKQLRLNEHDTQSDNENLKQRRSDDNFFKLSVDILATKALVRSSISNVDLRGSADKWNPFEDEFSEYGYSTITSTIITIE